MSTPKPIHIFKHGRHTAMSGAVLDFTEHDLAASAQAYDPALHEAPLVVGHPKHDAPAYGWVKSLTFADGGLQAEPRQVDTAFLELVQQGRFKKISASFYPPDAPNNPKPGVYYLRHVGFLGAQSPAVKGLKQVEFAEDGDCVTIEFSEPDAAPAPITEPSDTGDSMSDQDKARLAALEAENAELKRQQAKFAEQQKRDTAERAHVAHVAFAEGLIKEGRLLPAQKELTVVALDYLACQENVIEFGEGDAKKPIVDAIKDDLLAKLPKQVEFGEVSGDRAEEHAVNFAAPDNLPVDTVQLKLHNEAMAYAHTNKTDYQTALAAVSKRK